MNEDIQILIVEDSPTQARRLELLLREQGYRVIVAANGEEGLSLAQKERPRLVISDIMMPVKDGYEMCRAIKNDPAFKDLPILLLTTLSEPADILKALDVQADGYISKPYKDSYLLSKVSDCLNSFVQSVEENKENQLEINFEGKKYYSTSDRPRILTLLLSTYEDAVMKNRELIKTKEILEDLNEQLEERLIELTASEDRFKGLVMTIPDIVYRIDSKGNFIFLNKAIQKLGYEQNELLGRHFSQIILPEDVLEVSREKIVYRYAGKKIEDSPAPKLFDERRTGDRQTEGLEVRLISKKGTILEPHVLENLGKEVFVVEINSAGLYEEQSSLKTKAFVGTVGVIRDITSRKLIEDKLKKAYEEMEAKVELRTKELREINLSLREEIVERERVGRELENLYKELKQSEATLIEVEKVGALGTLTAGIAHELNNPMMGMLNFVQYCIKHTQEDNRIFPVLQDIERETRRCAEIVKNLLIFSRLEKEGEEKFRKCDLTLMLERILKLLAYRIEKENVLIDQHKDDGIPECWIKENNMQQVFLNIIGNALDAVKEMDRKEIHVEITRAGEFVLVTISDTGCGISLENQSRIFDPFFTTKPVGKGTGLGLSICQSIMKDHGGRINCQSSPGAGTRFEMVLPINGRTLGI